MHTPGPYAPKATEFLVVVILIILFICLFGMWIITREGGNENGVYLLSLWSSLSV